MQQFAHRNKISVVARAHQLVMEGFKWMFDKQLVTVWSAPNYCYRCGNMASIMEVDETLSFEFKTFGPAPEQRTGGKASPAPLPDYFL